MAKDDVYIQLLRMAKAELTTKPEGITYDDFIARMHTLDLKQKPDILFNKIYDPGGQRQAHMGLDAYMMLLEYEELKHSLEESRQARKEAKIAIWISILAIVAQIIFR